MRQIRFQLAALGAATLLVACGGGDSTPNVIGPVAPIPFGATLNGVAATGAAFSNAALVAKCATGAPVTGTTAANGTFIMVLTGGQTAPCMLQATKAGVSLYSFAETIGLVNITPLTDLAVTRAIGADPTALFASFDAAKGAAVKAGFAAAKTYVRAQVTAVTGGTLSGDVVTGVFSVGDADDKLLDTLGAKLAAGDKKQGDLRLAATAGAPIAASLDRGSLVDPAAVVFTLSAAQIDAGPLKALTGPAKCDVKVVALNYNTIGVNGEKTNASGVMLVPAGSATCTTASGLVAYAKGTDVQKLRTLANPQDGETFLLAAFYAAQGYTVVASDLLGYAKSAYAYHPYLHADSEATTVIDSIRAARKAAPSVGGALNGKVMLTGYSAGGHASMATHRAIERDNASEITVAAGAHLAGPYNLSGSFKAPNAIAGNQYFVTFLVTAWQKIYGNIYSDVNAVFKAPYASGIENLLPSATLDFTTLVTTGKLPFGTPNQARDALFQSAFTADVQTNSNSALFLAGKKNDTTGWNPKAQTLMCGGAGDPTVPPALHQTVAKADFDSRGLTNVRSVDVDSTIQAVYGINGVAPTDPTSAAFGAYYGSYHGSYEPPFCHAAARGLFDAVK